MFHSIILTLVVSLGLLQNISAAPVNTLEPRRTCPKGSIVFNGTGSGTSNPLFGTCISCANPSKLPPAQAKQCWAAGYK